MISGDYGYIKRGTLLMGIYTVMGLDEQEKNIYTGTLLFPIVVVNTFNLSALEAEGGDL